MGGNARLFLLFTPSFALSIPSFPRKRESRKPRVLSESGFAGLKDFQDSAGERVCIRRAFAHIRLGGIFVYGEKRKLGKPES